VAVGASLAVAGIAAFVPLALLRVRHGGPAAPWRGADLLTATALVGVGLAAGLALANAAGPPTGDALFHLGRARKLAELDSLSLNELGEFRHGDLHPGYAFPLWQAFMALVARLADIDVTAAGERLPVLLIPISLVCAYAAGRALLRSRAGGLAVAFASLAVFDFDGDLSTSFRLIGFPIAVSTLILVPTALALVFSFTAERRRSLLVALAAAGAVLAAVHPTYAPFLCIVLAGFAGAALIGPKDDVRSVAFALATFVASSALVLAWYWSIAPPTPPGSTAAAAVHFSDRLAPVGSSFVLDPSAVLGQQGAALALLAIPLALLAAPRPRAFIIGATALVAACLFIPPLFEHIADAASLSQALRLRYFLPLPFALVAAAFVLGRRGTPGLLSAVAVGATAPLLTARIAPPWSAVPLAVAVVMLLLAHRRMRGAERSARCERAGLACAMVLVVPTLIVGIGSAHLHGDPDALTKGVIRALATRVAPGDVILAPPVTAYRALAYAPAYAVAVPLTHVAQTVENHSLQRIRDASLYFYSRMLRTGARRRLLERYGVDWIVEDRRRAHSPRTLPQLRLVYADQRYRLFKNLATGATPN
jgi:hypothetical protein